MTQIKNRVLTLPRLIVSDFDGVMTDNTVMLDQDGRESVRCHRGDGWGISLLRKKGIEILVLSTEKNPVVAARCRKLGIESYQDASNKYAVLQKIAAERQLSLEQILYIGNDTNDLECIRGAGCGVAVSDSHPEVLQAAKLVLKSKGGEGALRELYDVLSKLF